MTFVSSWKDIKLSAEVISAVTWSVDGLTLVAGDRSGSVLSCDPYMTDPTPIVWGEHETLVASLVFNHAGTVLVSASDGMPVSSIMMWDVSTRQLIRVLDDEVHSDFVQGLSISLDDSLLASAAGEVVLWSMETGMMTRVLDGLWTVSFSPVDMTLASGARGDRAGSKAALVFGLIKFWDVATGAEEKTLASDSTAVFDVVFSPTGKMLASRGRDRYTGSGSSKTNLITVWDVRESAPVCIIHAEDHIDQICFLPREENRLVSIGDPRLGPVTTRPTYLTLWDCHSGVALERQLIDPQHISRIAFSPNGDLLAGSRGDGIVRVWKINELS